MGRIFNFSSKALPLDGGGGDSDGNTDGPGHVEVDVLYPVEVGKELVEVVDVGHELLAQQALMLPSLSLLHQVDHHHWTAVP